MVEKSEGEATIEEIVVALRETRRGGDRLPALTVVDGKQSDDKSVALSRFGEDIDTCDQGPLAGALSAGGATDIVDLHAEEIERLMTENTHLNQRVAFLLKIIQRQQGAAEQAATETDRGASIQGLRTAIEGELRPFLLVLLRLLEKQRGNSAGLTEAASAALWPTALPPRENIRLAAPEAASQRVNLVTARSVGSSR